MEDDIAAVRTTLEKFMLQGKEVILVLHSAGGFLGSEAVKGIHKSYRETQGEKRGVRGITFIAGAVYFFQSGTSLARYDFLTGIRGTRVSDHQARIHLPVDHDFSISRYLLLIHSGNSQRMA
jgi:hypothetical protein